MEMPKPVDAYRNLEKLTGLWVGHEKMYPSPWDPNGGIATGHSDCRPALDGFAVVLDYKQERDGVVNFRGHGVFVYNQYEEVYLLHWFDFMGTPPNIFSGQFDGDLFALTQKNPIGYSRLVYDFSHPKELRSRMDMSQDNVTWSPLMEGVYQWKG